MGLPDARSASLYDGPSAREVDLVDTKLLLAVSIANTSVDIVVVEHGAHLGVVVNTLTTRAIDPTMRLQDSGAAAAGAVNAVLVDKSTGGTSGPTDLDLVLLTFGGPVGIETTALADGEEEIMILAVQSNERGFLGMCAFGLEGDVGDSRRAGLEWWVGHADTEKILPERSEGHDELGAIPVEGSVDGIVILAAAGLDAGGTVVSPGAEVFASCNTDGRVLDTKRGDTVVEIVSVADQGHIGSLGKS